MTKFKVKRRFPNYFSGFEETEHIVFNKKELEEIEWINNAMNYKGFYSLALDDCNDGIYYLMALYDYNEEYKGCRIWWVIGYVYSDSIEELNIPEFYGFRGQHKDGCPQKEWQHDKCICGFTQ